MSWTKIERHWTNPEIWIVTRGMGPAVAVRNLPEPIKLRILLASENVGTFTGYRNNMKTDLPIDVDFRCNGCYLLYLSHDESFFIREGRTHLHPNRRVRT